jgi:hypothetical protein
MLLTRAKLTVQLHKAFPLVYIHEPANIPLFGALQKKNRLFIDNTRAFDPPRHMKRQGDLQLLRPWLPLPLLLLLAL